MFVVGADLIQTVLKQERGATDVPAEVITGPEAENLPVELLAPVHSRVHFINRELTKRVGNNLLRHPAQNLPRAHSQKLLVNKRA